ncbi:hypothetical protein OA410_02145 [Paracoccaceae bacterium]|nr:hypothetical protein [Paracoccaceae bacterium]
MIYMFGYGIQGRAHALNLRDSGRELVVINRKDTFFDEAVSDGFSVNEKLDLSMIKENDIFYILIPEEAHRSALEKYFKELKKNITIVFAHGYTLVEHSEFLPKTCDLLMIAPRFPGAQVRKYFENGTGVPAYISVHQDISGNAESSLENLCTDLGFSKGGVLNITAKQEMLVDLAIENIMAPSFFVFVQKLFEKLVERGVPPEVACMELYYSGETAAVRNAMSKFGLYKGLQVNASPTCQYGVSSSSEALLNSNWVDEFIDSRLSRIESGQFSSELSNEFVTRLKRENFFKSEVSKRIREAEIVSDRMFKKSI